MRHGVIIAQTSVQNQVLTDGIAVHHKPAQTQCLEVGDDKTPSPTTVVLIFAAQTTTQLMIAQGTSQLHASCIGALVKASLQRVVGLRHIPVTDGL